MTITKDGLIVPFDVADTITLENLKQALDRIRQEMSEYEKGEWVHPDDVVLNRELIPALERVIWYYGGEFS